MPDWRVLVGEQMGGLGLTAVQRELIVELAGHLEDLYEEGRTQGLSEPEAIERTLDEVGDWRVLALQIRRAKREEENMNARTRSLWLLGLISLTAANVFLMILTQAGLPPHLFKLGSFIVPLYVQWLVVLPLCGATGAYLSRRAGGKRLARLAAGLFPSIALLALICVVALTHRIIFVPRDLGSFDPGSFTRAVVFVAAVPGIALLLGALPFLKAPKAGVFAKG